MKKLILALTLSIPLLAMGQTTSAPANTVIAPAASSNTNSVTHRWVPKVGIYYYQPLDLLDTTALIQTIANLYPRGDVRWLRRADSVNFITQLLSTSRHAYGTWTIDQISSPYAAFNAVDVFAGGNGLTLNNGSVLHLQPSGGVGTDPFVDVYNQGLHILAFKNRQTGATVTLDVNSSGKAALQGDTTGWGNTFLRPQYVQYTTIEENCPTCVIDGTTDNTAAILATIAYAKSTGKGIWLKSGKHYIFTPTGTVDITGIPEIGGYGIIDAKAITSGNFPPSANVLLQVTGTKALLQNGVAFTANTKTVTLNTGLNIKPGQTLLIYANEANPNAYRTDYFKGQRVTVDSYDSSTGILYVYEPFWYNITSAYVWVNDYQPYFKLGAGVTIIGNPTVVATGISSLYANIDINGEVDNFAAAAVIAGSSFMKGSYRAYNSYKYLSGESYGLDASDLSVVYLKDCDIRGAAHAVAAGGGLEYQTVFGGSGSLGGAFPGQVYITGGTFTNSNTSTFSALDAHGIVHDMVISGVTAIGGVDNAAANFTMDNSIIHYNNLSGYQTNNEAVGATTCNVTISNTHFIADTTVANTATTGIRSTYPLNSLAISNVTIDDRPPASGVNGVYITGNIQKIAVNGLTINTSYTGVPAEIDLYNSNGIFNNINITGAGLYMPPQVAGLTVKLNNVNVNGGKNGINLSKYSSGFLNAFTDVTVNNSSSTGNQNTGLLVGNAAKLTATNNSFTNNGLNTGSAVKIRTGLLADSVTTLVLSDNNLSASNGLQQYGIYHVAKGTTTYQLTGNQTTGNVSNPVLAGTQIADPSTTQAANTILAAPDGSNGPVTYRALAKGDARAIFIVNSTSGTLDWNDATNNLPGYGPTLLRDNATNGFGATANLYYVQNIQFSGIAATNNHIQFAYPYSTNGGIWYRLYFSSAFGSWQRLLDYSNITGDITFNSSLVAAIGASKITTAMIAANAVDLTTKVTGALPVANGGTGQSTYTNGQLLIGNTTGNTLTKATLSAGYGTTVTNGTGSITLASDTATSIVSKANLASQMALKISADVVNTATDANYTVTSANQLVKLPVVTANRTVSIPTASTYTGRIIRIWNQNTSGTFSWSFTGATVKDAANNTLTALVNSSVYMLESDGTNWLKLN